MSNKNHRLWTYVIGENGLSEEEFKTLAQEAKEMGLLGQLYDRIKEYAELHRFAKDHFTINEKFEQAERHQKRLAQAERDLAILEYLRFSHSSTEDQDL